MDDSTLLRHAERELKYHARREIASSMRKHCPKGDPMVTRITVMLGTVLAMAAFNAILRSNDEDRYR